LNRSEVRAAREAGHNVARSAAARRMEDIAGTVLLPPFVFGQVEVRRAAAPGLPSLPVGGRPVRGSRRRWRRGKGGPAPARSSLVWGDGARKRRRFRRV